MAYTPTIKIEKKEKSVAKSFSHKESVIEDLVLLTEITGKSFNDVMREIIDGFLTQGLIEDPASDEGTPIKEYLKEYRKKQQENNSNQENQQ